MIRERIVSNCDLICFFVQQKQQLDTDDLYVLFKTISLILGLHVFDQVDDTVGVTEFVIVP